MFPTFHTAICFCSSIKLRHKNDLIQTRVTLLSNDNVVLSRDLVLLLKLMQKWKVEVYIWPKVLNNTVSLLQYQKLRLCENPDKTLNNTCWVSLLTERCGEWNAWDVQATLVCQEEEGFDWQTLLLRHRGGGEVRGKDDWEAVCP